MDRARREIKTPKRFDEETPEVPKETPPKPVAKPPKVVRSGGFKVCLPKKQKVPEVHQPIKERRAPELEDTTPPKLYKPPKEYRPPKERRAPAPEDATPPKLNKPPKEYRPPKERRTPVLEDAIPPRIYRLPKEYRPPKDRRAPAYEDIIPNLKLPFWDARTAAEDHEDDNVKELVHCQCSIAEELGLMVQCETCLTWQHAHCLGVERAEDAPDGYTCQACFNPKFVRESMRWAYDQDWLLKGRMKQFLCDPNPPDERSSEILTQINRLIDDTLKIYKLIHSLRVKARLLSTANDDNPELKLFRVQWPAHDLPSTSIQPIASNHEATPEDCRENLRRHIEQIEELISTELSQIEKRVAALEEKCVSYNAGAKSKVSFESLKSDLHIMLDHIRKTQSI